MGYLRIRGLSKAYKRYPHQWSRLVEWLSGGRAVRHTPSWVLRGVSFDVSAGESIGIVGKNGAGKSTLLKIITGTAQPTDGTVEIGGRVAALLELGMGFHPEFTGRQNVYMAGQLLGLSTAEIDAHMPVIEGFAEIGSYIDEPLRTYSSGMQVRLAFSVATATRPQILIIDEALSVGDAYFQHKCFARIREFKEQGTTLLFVSHDPGTVKTLCDRAILLDEGLMIKDAAPDEVLDYYNALIAKREADNAIRQVELETGKGRSTRSGNRKAAVRGVDVLQNGQSVRAVRVGDPVTIRVGYSVLQEVPELTVGILLRDRLGNDVFGTNTYHLGLRPPAIESGVDGYVNFDIPCLGLGVGNYSLTVALHSGPSHLSDSFDWWDHALVFQVIPGSGPEAIGLCNFATNARWARQQENEVVTK